MSKGISLENLQVYDTKIKEYVGNIHPNKDVLGKLTEDSLGNLLYNGKEITTGGSGGKKPFSKIFSIEDWILVGDHYSISVPKTEHGMDTGIPLFVVVFDGENHVNVPYSFFDGEIIISVGTPFIGTLIISDLSSGGGSGGSANEEDITLLREQIIRQQLSIIKMQFKYDMALNFTRNSCGDYIIDTLENNDEVEEMFNCTYESISQAIK